MENIEMTDTEFTSEGASLQVRKFENPNTPLSPVHGSATDIGNCESFMPLSVLLMVCR